MKELKKNLTEEWDKMGQDKELLQKLSDSMI